MRGNESFLERELKFGRGWLHAKGVMLPEEDRNPVDVELESFFDCCHTGKRPLADLEAGLAVSTTVTWANLAIDEGRRVYFNAMDKMDRGQAPAKKKASLQLGGAAASLTHLRLALVEDVLQPQHDRSIS